MGGARPGQLSGCGDCGHDPHLPRVCRCGCGESAQMRYALRFGVDQVLRTLVEYHGCDPDQIQRRER